MPFLPLLLSCRLVDVALVACEVTAALPFKLGCGLVNLVLVPAGLLPFELPGVGADVVSPTAAFLPVPLNLSILTGNLSAPD